MKKLLVGAVSWLLLSSFTQAESASQTPDLRISLTSGSRVLDGDTLVIAGQPIKLAGIDAPELGPWARCWAEAALAGHAKAYVETLLVDGDWSLDGVITGANGTRTARVVRREDGEDLSDLLVVYGYAARTTGRWDWCGENANLHAGLEGEPPPYGPNLWWPTGHMFDARAPD